MSGELIGKVGCDHCENNRSTQFLADSYGGFYYCDECAEVIERQAEESARRLAKEGHFHD